MPEGPLSDLVAAARSETILSGVGLTDPGSMGDVLFARFSAEVAPWAELRYEQDVNPFRVMERLESGDDLDFMIVANPSRLDAAGLIEPFDQPDRDSYPAGWTDPESRWLPLYVQPTVLVFNRYHVTQPPASWASLVEEKWRDALVFEAPWRMLATGAAFAELQSVFEERWGAWIAKLGARRPLIVADNERSVLEVATGRRRLGFANWNVARRVRPTSPMSHAFLNPTPCVPGFGALPRGAKRGNLGRLFLAWLGSPSGQAAYAATGRIPAMPDVAGDISLSTVIPPGVDALFGSVDWLGDPEPFVDRYRTEFSAEEPLAEGKLR